MQRRLWTCLMLTLVLPSTSWSARWVHRAPDDFLGAFTEGSVAVAPTGEILFGKTQTPAPFPPNALTQIPQVPLSPPVSAAIDRIRIIRAWDDAFALVPVGDSGRLSLWLFRSGDWRLCGDLPAVDLIDSVWADGRLLALVRPQGGSEHSAHVYEIPLSPDGRFSGLRLTALSPPGFAGEHLAADQGRVVVIGKVGKQSRVVELRGLEQRSPGWADFGEIIAPHSDSSEYRLAGNWMACIDVNAGTLKTAQLHSPGSTLRWSEERFSGSNPAQEIEDRLAALKRSTSQTQRLVHTFRFQEPAFIESIHCAMERGEMIEIRWRVASSGEAPYSDWNQGPAVPSVPVGETGVALQYQLVQASPSTFASLRGVSIRYNTVKSSSGPEALNPSEPPPAALEPSSGPGIAVAERPGDRSLSTHTTDRALSESISPLPVSLQSRPQTKIPETTMPLADLSKSTPHRETLVPGDSAASPNPWRTRPPAPEQPSGSTPLLDANMNRNQQAPVLKTTLPGDPQESMELSSGSAPATSVGGGAHPSGELDADAAGVNPGVGDGIGSSAVSGDVSAGSRPPALDGLDGPQEDLLAEAAGSGSGQNHRTSGLLLPINPNALPSISEEPSTRSIGRDASRSDASGVQAPSDSAPSESSDGEEGKSVQGTSVRANAPSGSDPIEGEKIPAWTQGPGETPTDSPRLPTSIDEAPLEVPRNSVEAPLGTLFPKLARSRSGGGNLPDRGGPGLAFHHAHPAPRENLEQTRANPGRQPYSIQTGVSLLAGGLAFLPIFLLWPSRTARKARPEEMQSAERLRMEFQTVTSNRAGASSATSMSRAKEAGLEQVGIQVRARAAFGTISWGHAHPMPFPLAGGTAFVRQGRLCVCDPSGALCSAAIREDGSIGMWGGIAGRLPRAGTSAVIASSGESIVCILGRTIYSAKWDGDSLGPWQERGAVPTGDGVQQLASVGGSLFAFGLRRGLRAIPVMRRIELNAASGEIQWTEQPPPPLDGRRTRLLGTGSRLYCLPSAPNRRVLSAALDPAGNLISWRDEAPLPVPMHRPVGYAAGESLWVSETDRKGAAVAVATYNDEGRVDGWSLVGRAEEPPPAEAAFACVSGSLFWAGGWTRPWKREATHTVLRLRLNPPHSTGSVA